MRSFSARRTRRRAPAYTRRIMSFSLCAPPIDRAAALAGGAVDGRGAEGETHDASSISGRAAARAARRKRPQFRTIGTRRAAA
ncbi:hypothetical protein A8E20_14430 [Burkholderia cenocepacia]|nr:hypothetical protein A8E20_14430 [Burkholderia cenocepacia]